MVKDSPRKALVGLNDSLIEADKIFAGLNIEKGYGHAATEVDASLKRKAAQIIDNDWLWFTLLRVTNLLGLVNSSLLYRPRRHFICTWFRPMYMIERVLSSQNVMR